MSMRVPNAKLKTKSFDGLISHIDVIPTLCDLIGIPQPDYLEGESFATLFQGEEYEGDEVVYGEINFHTSYEPVRSVRSKRFKYIRFFDEEYLKINKSNIDNSPIKEFYAENDLDKITKDSECLYDLYYDVYEKNNLVHNENYQKELAYMREKLDNFMEKTNDPLLNGPIEIRSEWKVNKRDSYSAGSKNSDDYDSIGQ